MCSQARAPARRFRCNRQRHRQEAQADSAATQAARRETIAWASSRCSRAHILLLAPSSSHTSCRVFFFFFLHTMPHCSHKSSDAKTTQTQSRIRQRPLHITAEDDRRSVSSRSFPGHAANRSAGRTPTSHQRNSQGGDRHHRTRPKAIPSREPRSKRGHAGARRKPRRGRRIVDQSQTQPHRRR